MYYPDDENDWLKILFSQQFKRWCISGHSSFAKKLRLSADEKVSLSSIANRSNIYTYILTIGVNDGKENDVKSILRSSDLAHMILKRIKKVFDEEVHIILFGKDNDERDVNEQFFSVSTNFKDYYDLKSIEMIRYFGNINRKLIYPRGTTHGVTTRVLDAFHLWSRENLGRFISKNVVNILDFEVPMIIKLRKLDRERTALENWEPYMSSSSSHACHNLICRKNNIILRNIVYRDDRKDIVMLHDVHEPEKEYMEGRCVIIERPNDMEVIKKVIKNGIWAFPDVKEYTVTP